MRHKENRTKEKLIIVKSPARRRVKGVSEMDKIMIVASLARSAGNDSVGEMWTETALFEIDREITDIIRWACKKNHTDQLEHFRGDLKLTIAQTFEVPKEDSPND